jgi:enoyl-[acyl-carrier protein] reductase II
MRAPPLGAESESSNHPSHDIEHDPEAVPDHSSPTPPEAVRHGAGHNLLPFAGQSVALVHAILLATELYARLITETEEALRNASNAVRPTSAAVG